MTSSSGAASGPNKILLQTLPPAVKTVAGMVGCDLLVARSRTPVASTDKDLIMGLALTGDINGSLVLVFASTTGCFLATRMLGHEQVMPLSRQALSALQELMNILASGMVMACYERLALTCQLHPPEILSELPVDIREAVCIQIGFPCSQGNLNINAYLVCS